MQKEWPLKLSATKRIRTDNIAEMLRFKNNICLLPREIEGKNMTKVTTNIRENILKEIYNTYITYKQRSKEQ